MADSQSSCRVFEPLPRIGIKSTAPTGFEDPGCIYSPSNRRVSDSRILTLEVCNGWKVEVGEESWQGQKLKEQDEDTKMRGMSSILG